MENLKVKWHKHSQSQFDRIATWYSCNMGAKAAMNFSEDVRRTVMLLSHSPRIGILEKRRSTVKTSITAFWFILNIALSIAFQKQQFIL